MRFKLNRDCIERRFAYLVITETGHGYDKGQIVICEVGLDGGGFAIEVGTFRKPRKLGCKYEQFDHYAPAINFSYLVADGND